MRTDVNLLGNGYASTVLKKIEIGFSKLTYLSPYDFNVLRSKINELSNSKLENINNQWVLSIKNPVNQAIRRPSNNSNDRSWLAYQVPIFYIFKTTIITDNKLNPGQIVFGLNYTKSEYDEQTFFKNKEGFLSTQNFFFLVTQGTIEPFALKTQDGRYLNTQSNERFYATSINTLNNKKIKLNSNFPIEIIRIYK
jgi:hypothetical protein